MPTPLTELLDLMRRLRDPSEGCPWDRQQTLESLVPHTLEEAYEVADAIERGKLEELPGELGDLLFQVVFYAQIAQENGQFDFDTVVNSIVQKLRIRHPHVFGAEAAGDAATQARRWESIKADERRARVGASRHSELDDVPLALPGLVRAAKLQRRAARVGFDWTSVAPVFDKVIEELTELRDAVTAGQSLPELELELGDLLFATVNLARHLGLDPEAAARVANAKFERRFRYIEDNLAAQGRPLMAATLAELDALWESAKANGL